MNTALEPPKVLAGSGIWVGRDREPEVFEPEAGPLKF